MQYSMLQYSFLVPYQWYPKVSPGIHATSGRLVAALVAGRPQPRLSAAARSRPRVQVRTGGL
eukprot:5846158-Prymnesium_polylepis.1